MLPSDMAALDPARVRGIVTERGEAHLARRDHGALAGHPALMGSGRALRAINQGTG
jgi:phosphoenolpyruvate-protein kinase (PTS system EI component)